MGPVVALTPRSWNAYAMAFLAVCASTLLTFALRPVLGAQAHYLTFTLAVIACALYGGFGPGLTATVAGFLSADYFFIEPLYTFFPVDVEDAAMLGAVGVSVSVLTERLSRAQAKLSLATSAAGVGLYEWIVPKNRVQWSPEFARIYGIDHATLAGTLGDFMDRVHHDDAQSVNAALHNAIRARQPDLVQEFRIVRPDGTVGWIEARSRIYYNKSGAPLRVFGANIDITERHNRERERELLMDAERAARRDAEEARKALAASNEDLQRFASAIAHDLQAPLRTLGIYTELLVRRAGAQLDEESRTVAAAIVKSVDQLRSMVQGLLDFCRASYEASATAAVTDAGAVVDRALEYLGPGIQENDAIVTRDPLPLVPVDPDQLLQVFLNLLGNAIKYRGTEPPRIHVTAQNCGDRWTFSVADNGIGIAPQYHEQIFGIFERLHSSSEFQGAGIGLATVRRVVERLGGRVWVNSQPGQGSIFSFTIPHSSPSN